MSCMDSEDRNSLVDLVAQAVIDKIEERDRINGLANLVVARVLELQREETELRATEQSVKPARKRKQKETLHAEETTTADPNGQSK